MFENFDPGAREVVHLAQEESRALGHNYVGTEHLLLALFADTGLGGTVLRSFGVQRGAVLAQHRGIVGPCDRAAARPPDPSALGAIGVDLDEVRRRVDAAFGPGALEGTDAWRRHARLRLTDRSKKVFELAVNEARSLGHASVRSEHLLLGLAAVEEGLAAQVLARLGVPPWKVRVAVLERLRRLA
ncbi:MAG TPA: Clp protease N-terminal domain-containing protein [Actinomycetota bacterium]|nr:Clp protease N-terminal domain-containing protein [Actinomycetota bacterium]